MKPNRSKVVHAAIATTCLAALGAVSAYAQGVEAPASVTNQPSLTLTEIEQILQKEGIRVTEIEVKYSVVEAEGRDAQNREVDVIVDRRSGEVLSRQLDD
jgi:hypothetical protein